MNENMNLCEILKGHEGETFYSEALGDVNLYSVEDDSICIVPLRKSRTIGFTCDGYSNDLFPSKDQRDWKVWKENNKTPKTWSELIKKVKDIFTECAEICSNNGKDKSDTFMDSPIEKSALSLLKIHQLIEVGYGGNITSNEWKDWRMDKYLIVPHTSYYEDKNGNWVDIFSEWKFLVIQENAQESKTHIAFHTKEQAKEFLKYQENVQLLRDYYLI